MVRPANVASDGPKKSLILHPTKKLLGHGVVEFIPHALRQMKIRGITADQVMDAIRRPTETGLPTQMYRSRIRRQMDRDRALDVVYEELIDRVRVITAFVKEFKKK